MMKPKVALVKDGFLPAGSENKRGRLSGDAIERCKQLAAQGWKIEGYEVSQSAGESGDTPQVNKVKVENGSSAIADIGPEIRPETDWIAKASGNEIGMRTVCGCGNSLTYCKCATPMVWVDHLNRAVVEFFPRPAGRPLPNKWW